MIYVLDSEEEYIENLKKAGIDIQVGSLGYRQVNALNVSLNFPPHEVDAFIYNLTKPACLADPNWRSKVHTSLVPEIAKNPTEKFEYIQNGSLRQTIPHFRQISLSDISQIITSSKFNINDMLKAIEAGGIPLIVLLNPEHIRHTYLNFLDFLKFDFPQKITCSLTEANRFSIPENLLQSYQGLQKLNQEGLRFKLPLKVKVDAFPASRNGKNAITIVTNTVNETLCLFIPYGRGCVFLSPQLEDPIEGTKTLLEIVPEILKIYNDSYQKIEETIQKNKRQNLERRFAQVKNPIPQKQSTSLECVEHILKRFHLIAKKILQRHDKRNTLKINDEYDVQDLLYALLHYYFDDVRAEEWTPSHAGSSSRMDFLLIDDSIAIEVKYATESNNDKKIANDLVLDNEWYQKHPNCKILVHFIYDPNERLKNPTQLIKDLSKKNGEFESKVVISPHRF